MFAVPAPVVLLIVRVTAFRVMPTTAQKATPSPGTDGASFVAGPEECTVEPRSAESSAALATPVATGNRATVR